jgi:D-3-phosphoglycerate dehydrogenase
MSSQKILITTRSFRKIPGRHQDILTEAGYEIINSPYDRALEGHELAEIIPNIVGAILGVDHVTKEVFDRANALQVISRFGIGVDRVDLAAATAHGVIVANTPGANSVAVAELTIGLMLALARQIPRHNTALRQDDWTVIPGVELSAQTLGLLGMGRIGREVAKRAAAFDMKILFYDPIAPEPEFVDKIQAQACTIEQIIAESDFLSLHLPLIDTTQNLINAAALQKMKPTAFLINTARGGLVDETALYEALKERTIAGAAFDTFAQEPSHGNPLLTLDNFIATPHSGSATLQTTLRMGLMASENLLAVLQGQRPVHVVNPEVYDRTK